MDPLIKSQLLYQLSYAPGLPRREPPGARGLAKAVGGVQQRAGDRTRATFEKSLQEGITHHDPEGELPCPFPSRARVTICSRF